MNEQTRQWRAEQEPCHCDALAKALCSRAAACGVEWTRYANPEHRSNCVEVFTLLISAVVAFYVGNAL